jgi:chromosome segregation ATPase
MEILKKTVTLEAKLSEQQRALDSLIEENSKEKELHESRINELKTTKEGLEKEIGRNKELLDNIKAELISKNERNKALAQQYDGLLKQQAERLQVQPDIDAVCEALPARRKEREELEGKIKENGMIIAGATAISDLLSKRPNDRDAIISFLRMAKGEARYTPRDEVARQAMIRIMADQGYVSQQTVETIKKGLTRKSRSLTNKQKCGIASPEEGLMI